MKLLKVLLGVLLVLVVVTAIYKLQKPAQQMDKSPAAQETTPDTVMKASRYTEYSKAAFNLSTSNRRVLFFYANWCPTCRPADQSIRANEASIPDDVEVFRVNYNDTETDNDEKALAAQYGVTYQHTFVQVDAQGNEVTKWNGGQFNELIKNLN